MAPLQRAVYWRLSLMFFFAAFLFFLDVFTVTVTGAGGSWSTCGHRTPGGNLNFTAPGPGAREDETGRLVAAQSVQNDSLLRDVPQTAGNGTECVAPMLLSYGQMMYMTGLLLGSLFGGALSDRYGKRVVLLASMFVHALCGLLPAALPHLLLFLFLRCLTGVTCCCINICSFSLGVEWSLPRHRIWPPALLSFSFSLGMMALAPIAYLTHTWTQLHLALGLPQLICLPLYIGIPESPRWLLLKKRTDVLEKYRRHSSEDRVCLDQLLGSDWDVQLKASEAEQTHPPPAGAADTVSDFTHLRSPTVLLRLGIMSYIGFASALTYYGICLNVGSFGVNVYLAQFYSGLTESPCLLVPFLLARCGRRPMSMLSLLLSGTACLLSLVVSRLYDSPAIVMGLALIGKFCMTTTVFVSLLYGIELFPTVVRQKCVALVNLCYRVGCILNTLVSASGGIPLASMIVYSSGPIIGSGLCLLLPETSGVPLPDSVEDCDRQPRLRLPGLDTLCRKRHAADTPVNKTPLGEKDPEKSGAEEAVLTNTHTLHTDTHTPHTETHTPCTERHTPCTETHTLYIDTPPPHTETHTPCTETHTLHTDTHTPHTETHTPRTDTGII